MAIKSALASGLAVWGALAITDTSNTASTTARELTQGARLALQGPTRYVVDGASAGGDGLAWATAYPYLQDALLEAASEPEVTEIRIAGGMYRPDRDEGGQVTPGDREATFRLRDGLDVRGGYAGPGAADPDERDPSQYPTVLTGDLADDDGADFANNTENSYHVVTVATASSSGLLDGVTITGGNANGSYPRDIGGGLYIEWQGNITIADCIITGNAAQYGGGAYSAGSEVALTGCSITGNRAIGGGGVHCGLTESLGGCTIADNEATQNGAGMRCLGDATITGCTVRDNTATGDGGGLHCAAASPSVSACTFTGNEAANGAGAFFGDTGAAEIADCAFNQNIAAQNGGGLRCGSTTAVDDCTFNGNDAGNVGGGAWGGGTATLTGCTFTANSADGGGGVACVGNVTLDGCTIDANIAGGVLLPDGLGGGVYCSQSAPQLVNCLVTHNIATNDGAGVYGTSEMQVVNCTVTGNTALFFGGALCLSMSTSASAYARNGIFWQNTAAIGQELALLGVAKLRVAYSSVQGAGGAAYVDDDAQLLWGLGNPNADPLFVDAGADDYRIAAGSPGIDAGDNYAVTAMTDLAGNPRQVDDPATPDTGLGEPPLVDLGAFEFQALAADLDGDGDIDWDDLAILTGCWSGPGNPSQPVGCQPEHFGDADLDVDGDVDLADLAAFAAAFDE